MLAGLNGEAEQRTRHLAAHFLQTKTITVIGDLALDAHQRVLLAALCCLPLRQLGRNGLQGWSQVLVYPEAFRVQRTHLDAGGVLHEYEEDVIGEAWESGPLILSWADVLAELESPEDGFCVVVHEMAHKIDALDGALDGTPPLPHAWQQTWARDFQQAYDTFCALVDTGTDTLIDPYAAEAPEEFFAVVSEYHFTAPQLLAAAMPRIAMHLERYYGPSPLAEKPTVTGPAAA